MADIHSILYSYWGYTSFRPLQEDIIRAVIAGDDTLAIMPTGGGKSLCFQVPALVSKGLCLVVTPLIALMKDQIQNLKSKGIQALSVHSGMSFSEVRKTLDNAVYGNFKFLYVSPERLNTNLFKEYLPALPINLIAVDEAHCISQWGYDFRPAYLTIASLREEKPEVTLLALTASATLSVQEDICDKLGFRKRKVFQQSYERPNLSYSVFNVDIKIDQLLKVVQKVKGSSIVYCRSRKRTKEISEFLNLRHISADYYHAGLSHEERNEKQENWIKDKTRIMVCTNAFGMGIDKPNVRSVIHVDIPECLESYYQEAGRAGRDGEKAYAVLLYRNQDLADLKKQTNIRFPEVKEIKNIYQCIVNYLQLPAGTGKEMYFDFDIGEFTRLFRLNKLTVIYAVKALEQEGLIEYNDQIFIPSTVVFSCGKQVIRHTEDTYPALTPYIQFLLRSYAGIFDVPTPISEKQMAQSLKVNVNEVRKHLLRLHALHVIIYVPQKDTPQLRFLWNRIVTENLTINIESYKKRKEVFAGRVKAIVDFTTNTKDCRAQLIANYFNDFTVNACQICDNCIEKKKTRLSRLSFSQLQSSITDALMNGPLTIKELMERLQTTEEKKVWDVIQYLLEENYLEMNEAEYRGKISIKKKGQDRNPARF